MQDFDYMKFKSGPDIEFAAHAKKYTKREFLELVFSENKNELGGEFALRLPEFKDIKDAYLKSFNVYLTEDEKGSDNQCFHFCTRQDIHSFPVWLIDFKELKMK